MPAMLVNAKLDIKIGMDTLASMRFRSDRASVPGPLFREVRALSTRGFTPNELRKFNKLKTMELLREEAQYLQTCIEAQQRRNSNQNLFG